MVGRASAAATAGPFTRSVTRGSSEKATSRPSHSTRRIGAWTRFFSCDRAVATGRPQNIRLPPTPRARRPWLDGVGRARGLQRAGEQPLDLPLELARPLAVRELDADALGAVAGAVGGIDPGHAALQGDLVGIVQQGEKDEHLFPQRMGPVA